MSPLSNSVSKASLAKRLLCLLPLLTVMIPSQASAYHEYDAWRPVPDRVWDVVTDESQGILHAVVLFNGTIIDDRDKKLKKTRFSRYLRVRVLDEAGVDEFGSREIHYSKKAKIRHIRARTVKPDGSTIELDESDFHDKIILETGKYSVRAKVFAFKGVEPGDIVESFYAMESAFGWFPRIRLQKSVFTVDAKVIWHFWRPTPKEREILKDRIPKPIWDLTNPSSHEGSVRHIPDKKQPERLEVSFRSLPPLPDEPYMPPRDDVAVCFYGSYSCLEYFRKSCWKLLAGFWGQETLSFLEKQSGLDDWVDVMARRDRDLEQDIGACASFVHQRVRNIDFIPDFEKPEETPKSNNIDELLKNRLGRSFHINALVVAMLQRLGYKATLFWGRSRPDGALVEDWGYPYQLNMTGVVVRDGLHLRWCYPAAPLAGSRSLPWQIRGCQVLLEDLSGDEGTNPFQTFGKVPDAGPELNARSLIIKLQADSDGKAIGSLNANWSCDNDLLRIQELSVMEEEDAIEAFREDLLPGVEWNASTEALSFNGTNVTYACSLEVTDFLRPAGSRLLATPGRLRTDDYRFLPGNRRTGVDLGYPCTYMTSVEFETPEGYTHGTIEGAEFHTEFADYEFDPFLGSFRVRWTRKLTIHETTFSAEEADEVREFFESAYEADETPLVLSMQ